MGLLDELSLNEKDRDSAFNTGLLSMGLSMLQKGGKPMQALGSGGLQGMQAYQQAMEQAQAEKIQQYKMKQLQEELLRKKQQEMAQAEFVATLPPEMQKLAAAYPQMVPQLLSQEKKRHVVGNALVDDNGTPLYQAPEKPPAPSGIAKLIAERDALPLNHPARKTYDAAITKETTFAPPMQVNSYPAPVPVTRPDGSVVLAQFGNRGDVKETPYKPAPGEGKPPTEFEGKAAFYASNMKAASKVLDELESQGMNMSAIGSQLQTQLAGGAGNIVVSPRAQQARQAQNQWAEQMLRMQTGAAATKDEIARTVSTYFPQIGDGEDVVAQKRAMRQQAEGGVVDASGRAKSRVDGGAKRATLADIAETARKSGRSTAEVTAALKAKGYTIEGN